MLRQDSARSFELQDANTLARVSTELLAKASGQLRFDRNTVAYTPEQLRRSRDLLNQAGSALARSRRWTG